MAKLPWLLLGFSAAFTGAAGAVELGMPAPALSVAAWVKGPPVDLQAGRGTNIYVLQFLATWDLYSQQSVPSLSALQKKYRPGHVVLVAITEEPARKVKAFVRSLGNQLDYSLAIDDHSRTSTAYMRAFGVKDIPHVFVVDKSGVLAWHGPVDELEGVLGEMVAGRFELEVAKMVERTVKLRDEYFKLVRAPAHRPRAAELGRQIVTNFARMPGALDEFAWRILTDHEIQSRDLALALDASRAAFEATAGRNPSVLDTYARALFETGKHAEAIQVQTRAIALAKDQDQRLDFESRLNRYRRLVREAAK